MSRAMKYVLAVILCSVSVCFLPNQVMAQKVASAACGRCGRTVPPWSRAGGTCPWCGVVWGYEQNHYNDHSTAPAFYPPQMSLSWPPAPSRSGLREEARQRRVEYLRYLEAREVEKRAERRERLREATEEWRLRDDPHARALRHLAVAAKYQEQGDTKVAACYCRLAKRTSPEVAIEAEALLAGLAAQ